MKHDSNRFMSIALLMIISVFLQADVIRRCCWVLK